MSPESPNSPSRPELVRVLGFGPSCAIVVGIIIGSGIFLVPAEMMQAVGSPKIVFLAWIVGGLLSLFGTLTYAELGAMKPEAAGEYVYIRDAYGPLPGFLYAWTWFIISKPASIATITVGLVRILQTFPAFAFFSQPLFQSAHFSFSYGQLVAIIFTILVSILNYIGVKTAGDFQFVFTCLKVVIIVFVVMLGFTFRGGSWAHLGGHFPAAQGGMAGFIAALIAALWAYDGWDDLSLVSGEIRNPGRNIPLALIVGIVTVGGLYMLLNAAVIFVMPAAQIGASLHPASDAMTTVLGPIGASIVAAGMGISMLVTLNGTIMTGARVPYALARDGYFFSALGEVHPRFHTPSIALIVQAIVSIFLLLLGGSFRQLFSLAIFAEWLFYMIAASSIFVFRKREPNAVRPYRVTGYPFVPALFVAAAAVLLYYTFTDNLLNSALGTLVILAGIPVFYVFARLRRS